MFDHFVNPDTAYLFLVSLLPGGCLLMIFLDLVCSRLPEPKAAKKRMLL